MFKSEFEFEFNVWYQGIRYNDDILWVKQLCVSNLNMPYEN